MAKLNFHDRTGQEATALVDQKSREQVVTVPGETIRNGRIEIVSSGVAVVFSAPDSYVDTITIKAGMDNQSKIWVGGSGVACGQGIELEANESIALDIDNLRKIYAVGTHRQDYVTYIGMNIASIDDF